MYKNPIYQVVSPLFFRAWKSTSVSENAIIITRVFCLRSSIIFNVRTFMDTMKTLPMPKQLFTQNWTNNSIFLQQLTQWIWPSRYTCKCIRIADLIIFCWSNNKYLPPPLLFQLLCKEKYSPRFYFAPFDFVVSRHI